MSFNAKKRNVNDVAGRPQAPPTTPALRKLGRRQRAPAEDPGPATSRPLGRAAPTLGARHLCGRPQTSSTTNSDY